MKAHHSVNIYGRLPHHRAAGVLSLLSEPEDEIKIFALHRLDELVDDFWAEVADKITDL